ncbi:MAG: Arc family DNA-binding protein [Gemmobacter sp.]|nr:Arc family DNA-binding protein [Gemmobacter sp.]
MVQGRTGTGSVVPLMVRVPEDLRDRIKAAADTNGRSQNSEIVATLEEKYPAPVSAMPDLAEIYRLMDRVHEAAPDEDEQDRRLVDANQLLTKAGAPIILRFSTERDVWGNREIYMSRVKAQK